PNGAGKTTTLRILLGLIKPSAGSASILGHDTWRDSRTIHEQTGYLPADAALYPHMTGLQHIQYFSALRNCGRAGVELGRSLAERLDLDLSRLATTLSRGNRQKLALVVALLAQPRLLILDEPTSGLDPLVQQQFHALLAEHTAGGGSVLLSSHVLSEVERVADRVGIIRAGRVVAVEELEDMRAKSLHQVVAHFAEPVPIVDFERIADIRDVRLQSDVLTCSVPQSSLDAVLKLVARFPVVDLSCQEADLESTLLEFYGGQDDRA
ncbi:MAG: ABC transporter ATP-binding protein, partial [Actinomycetes bacterium]